MKGLLFAFLFLPVFVKAQIINTVAGNGSLVYSADSIAATTASFYYPMGVAVDAAGNIYISDALNAVVRKVNAAGIISTIAGTGITGFGGDGGQATADSAMLNSPSGLAVDGHGNLFIADAGNSRIRKVNTFGQISTVAGGGSSTAEGAPAISYSLSAPAGIAFDGAGNMYLSDDGRIHKITLSGAITTIAGIGGGGFSGDGGPATAASFSDPHGVAADAGGNIYVADKNNFRIRKINTSGIITTVAGNGDGAGTGYGAYSGDYGPAVSASLNFPTGVAAGPGGNIYIADRNNNRVRMLDPSGGIITIAGDGTSGFGGDGGPALSARLAAPGSVAVDNKGNVFIADELNNRIREVLGTAASTGFNNTIVKKQIEVYPNPTSGSFTVSGLSNTDRVCLYDVAGSVVYSGQMSGNTEFVDICKLNEGTYFLQILGVNGDVKEGMTIVKK